MKFLLLCILPCILCSLNITTNAQGRIVINEYLPWPSNGCGASSEFVELLNLGPGPSNIGCFILTDGDFSVTIPPNTILLPGKFYVIAGMDTLPYGCANISKSVVVDLNWRTCNCSSAQIPVTGNGFFTDGGTASEQVVLLDQNLLIVDALVRALPAESSSSITTSTVSGTCQQKSFNLGTMNFPYESIGSSTGRGNSFARKLDGDCGWIKDTQQSAGATNNTSGTTSDLTANLYVTSATGCEDKGSVVISFSSADYSTVFPVNYTLAYDRDNNNLFDSADTYIPGVDSTSSNVNINNLRSGRYRIVLAPASGCSYKTFDFSILPCGQLTLRNALLELNGNRTGNRVRLEWTANNCFEIRSFNIEKSKDGNFFEEMESIPLVYSNNLQHFKWNGSLDDGTTTYYRIKVLGMNNNAAYSAIIPIHLSLPEFEVRGLWPNPVENRLQLSLVSAIKRSLVAQVTDIHGRMHWQRLFTVNVGFSQLNIDLSSLPKGLYVLQTAGLSEDIKKFSGKIYKR